MNKTVAVPALTLAVALTGAWPAPAAGPSVAGGPPAPAALAPDRKVKVDVDGDGRKDTVTITTMTGDRYRVTAVTAKGRKSSVTITSTIEVDWGIEPYWGAAKLDKVKGYELLLATGGGDGYTSVVLTWRANTLTRQPAPKARSSVYAWYALSALDWGRSGYRFSTKEGKRYVKQYTLFRMGTKRWEGTIVTSRWKSGKWTKTASKRVKLTNAQVKKYPGGFTGVTIVARP